MAKENLGAAVEDLADYAVTVNKILDKEDGAVLVSGGEDAGFEAVDFVLDDEHGIVFVFDVVKNDEVGPLAAAPQSTHGPVEADCDHGESRVGLEFGVVPRAHLGSGCYAFHLGSREFWVVVSQLRLEQHILYRVEVGVGLVLGAAHVEAETALAQG